MVHKEIYIELQDTQWQFDYIDHDRNIARAIVYDENGIFYFVRAERDDDFGKATLIETAGGGVEVGEELQTAIQRELKEELNLNLEDIDYKIEFMEYPNETRNAYGFIAIGKINQTKDELKRYFEEYKEYLLKNDLEVEFNKLIFLKKENAIQELDDLPNYKRQYLRDLIKEVVKDK